ncbi:MAG TPA: hypothetical protein VMZ90_00180 [Vicinamibacterales bacterium]|nr:hypothetical protein [Vicinamibacterales bacterium]
MYIIRLVRVRAWKPLALLVCLVVATLCISSCANPLARKYEYDEQTYLAIDGSATVVLSASVAALASMRGLPLDPSPQARISSDDVRRVFEAAGCQVQRAARPWRRDGRRFVQARLYLADVRKAASCGVLAWSSYGFEVSPEQIRYTQTVGAPAGPVPATPPPGVGWNGGELVAFKLHLPSRVTFQNVRRLSDGEPGAVERGNILTWEQRLSDRLSGVPLAMEVKTESESILFRTVSLFAGAFAAAVIVLVLLIWFTIRRGRARLRAFKA